MIPATRSLLALVLACGFASLARADDDPLPKGAVARLGSAQRRTNGPAHGVVCSPDGKLVVAGEKGGLAVFAEGRAARHLSIGKDEHRALGFAPDGKSVVVAGTKPLRVDLDTGAATPAGIDEAPAAVAFRDGGREALFALEGGAVVSVRDDDAATRRLLVVSTEDASAVALSRDGRRLARADAETLHVLDLDGTEVLAAPADSTELIALAPDGSRVAAALSDGRIVVWDVGSSGHRTLLGARDAATALVFTPDAGRVLASSPDGTLRAWDAATGTAAFVARLPDGEPGSLDVTPDGRSAFVVSGSAVLRFDLASGSLEAGAGHTRPVEFLALSPDGSMAVSCAGGDAPVLWDVASRTGRLLPRRHAGDVTGLAWSSDPDVFASCGGRGGDVRLWSASRGATLPLHVGRTHGDGRGPAFSPDGRFLVVGHPWGGFTYWDLKSGTRFQQGGIGRTFDKVLADYLVAWSPDGALIATAHADGAVRLVPVGDEGTVPAYDVSERPADGLSWSPDGSYVAVVARGEIAVHRIDGLVVTRLAGSISAGALSPTSRLFAAGDEAGRVRLLSAPKLEWLAGTPAGQGAVRTLTFSGDGRRFATGGADGTVIVWDVAALLGAEPEPVPRAALSGVVPGEAGPRVFPPNELRVAKVEGLAGGERVEPYAGTLPGVKVGDDEVRAVLVLDGSTGRPMPHAVLRAFEEDLARPPGPAVATTTTDTYGLAWVVWDPRRRTDHFTIDAEGFAPFHVFGWDEVPRTVALFPAGDAVGRLFDPYGRPLAGAEVEMHFGCGHSPTMRRAVSGDDGLFRLPHCGAGDGTLTVRAPGVSADYLDGYRIGSLGDDPVTFVLHPGGDVEGRIVDLDGWPVGNVGVRAEVERTVTRTDADGRFRLRGVASLAPIEVLGPVDVGRLLVLDRQDWLRPAVPLTLVVPREEGEPGDESEPPVVFDAQFVEAASGAPVVATEATLVATATGLRVNAETIEAPPGTSLARFRAFEGEYLLLPGGPFATHAGRTESVQVRRDQATPHVVRVEAQPSLALEIEGDVEDADLTLVAGGEEHELDPDKRDDSVRLPAEGPAAVVVRKGALERAFPVAAMADGKRLVRVAWRKRKTVRVLGLPKDASFESERETRETSAKYADVRTVETHATGAMRLVYKLRGELFVADVTIPDEPGAVIDAQAKPLRNARIALRTADGKPLADTSVKYDVLEPPADEAKGPWDLGTDADGLLPPLGARTTDALLTLAPRGYVARSIVLHPGRDEGVAWGDATLVVEVADDAGKPLDAVLWLDGALVAAKAGRAEIRGLDAGRRTVLVGASDRQAQAIDLDVARGATRTIRVTLPEMGK